MFKKIISNKIFYGLISVAFVYINYSENSWNLFNNLGGIVWAKIGPEMIGIIFFVSLSFLYLKTFYKDLRIKIEKKEWFIFLSFFIIILIYRYKEFSTYFYHDDFYLVLNRLGTGYSKYLWGPWLSSFPLWTWEIIRSFSGYSVLPYQIASLSFHVLLTVGVYFLSKYLSKNYYIAIIISFLVLTTSISFEAFQWLIHPINFAWQGFFVCISIIALVWEIRKNKGITVPYLSALLMMPAFGAGIARIGFILPFISTVDVLASTEYLNIKKIGKWVKNLITRQWIFYFLVFTFMFVRNLYTITGTKTEVVTIPLYKLYLYVIGIFTFPVELFINLSKLSKAIVLPGTLTVWFGFLFLVASGIFVLITKIKKKKIPLILSIGFSWLLFSALYYTLFGPHLPANELEISIAARSHHLSYLGSIGSLMIWGYFLYQLIMVLIKLKKPFGVSISYLIIIGVSSLNYYWLSKQYDNFLELPKGVKIVRQQFFFDTYRKYISPTASKVNIFYDESYLKRKDNYRPNDGYYWAFWDKNKVKILTGFEELQKYLMGIDNIQTRNNEISNLYYIYTDYDDGLIEDNLSEVLRENILNPQTEVLSNQAWKTIWGQNDKQYFTSEIIKQDDLQINYFKNPVISINNLNFPAILPPNLRVKINVRQSENSSDLIDLSAGVLSHFLSSLVLPTEEQLNLLAKYYKEKSLQNDIDLNNIITTPNVIDKMVCEKRKGDGGILFLVLWSGEPESYYSKFSQEVRENIFSPFFTQRFYSLCYFSEVEGIKDINIQLPYTGSILRNVVIVPLTKSPISVKVLESGLKTPKIIQ